MGKYLYELIRSERKTLALEVTKNLQVVVRAPWRIPASQIEDFVNKHEKWISEHIEKQKNSNEAKSLLTPEQIERLKYAAKTIIPRKVEYYSKIIGLVPTAVRITSAKTRFGSCSPKNVLCFSYLLMQYPEEAVDYVIVHELAHIAHHNHGQAFYDLIEKHMPDHKTRRKLLK